MNIRYQLRPDRFAFLTMLLALTCAAPSLAQEPSAPSPVLQFPPWSSADSQPWSHPGLGAAASTRGQVPLHPQPGPPPRSPQITADAHGASTAGLAGNTSMPQLPPRDYIGESRTPVLQDVFEIAKLPPPPGWNAAEYANATGDLYPTHPWVDTAPSPLKKHKDGFFQKASLTGTWLSRGGQYDLGLTEIESFLTFALPLPSADWPLLISPGFHFTFLSGPRRPDLPETLYDTYLDLMWLPQVSERWQLILAVSPGVYSDFDDVQSDAIRITGKGMARYDWRPGELQLLFGVLYLNRDDVGLLPAGGIIWTPNADTRYEALFPRPKFAHRLAEGPGFEDWAYLLGEFGGDTYSFQRANDTFDKLTLRDWRILFGLERVKEGGAGYRLEIGYVFSRVVEFASGSPDYESADTVLLRAGWTY